MANQPKTPGRHVRISDDLWEAAQERAAEEGRDVSLVIRAALEAYVGEDLDIDDYIRAAERRASAS